MPCAPPSKREALSWLNAQLDPTVPISARFLAQPEEVFIVKVKRRNGESYGFTDRRVIGGRPGRTMTPEVVQLSVFRLLMTALSIGASRQQFEDAAKEATAPSCGILEEAARLVVPTATLCLPTTTRAQTHYRPPCRPTSPAGSHRPGCCNESRMARSRRCSITRTRPSPYSFISKWRCRPWPDREAFRPV